MQKRCIAMAYGDQPLDRIVVAATERLAYVINPTRLLESDLDPLAGVGFPRMFVFEADPILLAELTEAYESGDASRLKNAWEKAKPIDLDAA